MMNKILQKPNEKMAELKDLDKESLLYRVMPRLVMEKARDYFRLEVEGMEHIPRRGAALIMPNHSGFSGFDAMILTHEIHRATNRIPRVLTHHLWFKLNATAQSARKVGFIEASLENGRKHLRKNNLVVIFPEGEHGNFKASVDRYNLQEFKRGFVRMALLEQTPIIPTLIIGAEETHLNLMKLSFPRNLLGLVLPLPLNIFPLPVKWKIVFLPPIKLPFKPSAVENEELVFDLAAEVREEMQAALSRELVKRESIFR